MKGAVDELRPTRGHNRAKVSLPRCGVEKTPWPL